MLDQGLLMTLLWFFSGFSVLRKLCVTSAPERQYMLKEWTWPLRVELDVGVVWVVWVALAQHETVFLKKIMIWKWTHFRAGIHHWKECHCFLGTHLCLCFPLLHCCLQLPPPPAALPSPSAECSAAGLVISLKWHSVYQRVKNRKMAGGFLVFCFCFFPQ